MSTPRRNIVWLLVVGLAVVALAWPRLRGGDEPAGPAPAASTSRAPLQARVEVVRPSTLEERLSTTGTILANETVDVVAEVPGKVEEIRFEEGRVVDAGQVLVKLDDAVARAELDRARYRFELATRREARQQELRRDGLISEEAYDSTVSELNVLAAEVALREAQIAKMELRAPFRGVVGLRDVSVGSYLSSQTRVTTIQDVDTVKIEFAVPERHVSEVQVGDEVSFRVKGADDAFSAAVYAIESGVDPATRSLTVRARTSNRGGKLIPGSFADVDIAIREVEGALSVPSIAVVPELGGKKVWIEEGGVASPRIVRTGIRTQDRVEITDGLEAGDRVIVSDVQRLRSGLEIDPVEAGRPGGAAGR